VFVTASSLAKVEVADNRLPNMEVQKVIGAQVVEDALQAVLIWLQEKELSPKTLGFFMILFILLLRVHYY
jgi:hypothetical protein